MFGWIADAVMGFFDGLMFYAILAFLGGVLGLACAFVGQRSLTAAAGLCACVFVAFQLFGALDRFADAWAQAEILRLEAKNLIGVAKIAELRVNEASLSDFLDEERIAKARNAEIITEMNAKIDGAKDHPECFIPKDIVDGIKKLR